jgi:hypothetical protein
MSKTETTTDKNAPAEVMTLKNFRSNGDIENFYRYIHENGLRREAFMMMEYAINKIGKVKKSKKSKLQ